MMILNEWLSSPVAWSRSLQRFQMMRIAVLRRTGCTPYIHPGGKKTARAVRWLLTVYQIGTPWCLERGDDNATGDQITGLFIAPEPHYCRNLALKFFHFSHHCPKSRSSCSLRKMSNSAKRGLAVAPPHQPHVPIGLSATDPSTFNDQEKKKKKK